MTRHTAPIRVMFYVQHLLGIGHLARASRIAGALAADGHDVTVVTGGSPVPGFPGPGIHHVALPPITSANTGFRGLIDENGDPVDEVFRIRRTSLLLAAFRECAPDVVMIEAFPFGRRQVRFELVPLLDAIHAMRPRPRVVVSLRDILQEHGKADRDAETVATVERYFDRVLVHGDPNFARLEDTFPLALEIADRVIYTGLVAPPMPEPSSDVFDIVVSAGGGAVGAVLVNAAVAAAARHDMWSWCVIAGPNLPQPDFETIRAAAPPHVNLVRFRQDFAGLLRNAKLSVSQAGYNTVCDILRTRCRSIVVPFKAGGETEQAVRAARLQDLGLVRVVTEERLSVDRLSAEIEQAMMQRDRMHHMLDLDGALATARLLPALLQDGEVAQL